MPWLGKLTSTPQSLNMDLHWWSCPFPTHLVLVLRDSDTGRVNEQGRAGVAEGSEGKADCGGSKCKLNFLTYDKKRKATMFSTF